MIVESGMIVALGLVFLFLKMKWKQRMWMLSRPVFMDVVVFLLLNMLHWGTFTGVMVAATGALICSALLTVGRKMYGYCEGRMYFPGVKDVSEHLR